MATNAAALEPVSEPRWAGAEVEDLGDLRDLLRADGLEELDRRLRALARERGPLRAATARIAYWVVFTRAWERLGFARLSDYSAERLGLSSRAVQSLAQVGGAFLVRSRLRLEEALVSGRLGWTKVRLLASLPSGEDDARWIARAQTVTAAGLAKLVRAVDRSSVEEGAVDEERARSRVFEVPCSSEVLWKWHGARTAAARAAGRRLRPDEAAELIAAEVLSALPIDQEETPAAAAAACDEWGTSWSEAGGVADGEAPPPLWSPALAPVRAAPDLQVLLDGIEDADAFGLDARLCCALAREQRLDARMGPLLARIWERGIPRSLGYATREAYARERLGMDPTRARALVRLERAAAHSPPFAHAWRSGALSWVQAAILVPMLGADPLGRFVPDWILWAGRVSVRRLREDVERALTLSEADPAAFRLGGGLPPEAREDRDVDDVRAGREIGARRRVSRETPTGPEASCSVRFIGSAVVVQLFRAVLSSVRRRIEAETGRLPPPGEALGVMLDHALGSWDAQSGKVPARYAVLERDGWRCAVPGCSSMENLHDHHIRFRSAGGSDAHENRVTLCAFHHLRGVHAGRVRCSGRAPDGLLWGLGIRSGSAPLFSYRSGDLRAGSSRPSTTRFTPSTAPDSSRTNSASRGGSSEKKRVGDSGTSMTGAAPA